MGVLLVLGCGPAAQMAADTESETEDGSGTAGSTDDGSPTTTPPPTTDPTDPTNMTNAVDSSGGTDPDPTTGGTGPADSSGDGPDPDTGGCPPGGEGCLCDIGSLCDDPLVCVEGICVAEPACAPIDMVDHSLEDDAIELAGLGCDAAATEPALGTIVGPEADWYWFAGNDAGFCPEQPAAVVTADVPIDVCVFLECASGGDVQDLTCGRASTPLDSPQGRPGCCGESAALIEGYDCSGFGGKDANVYISLSSSAKICADYDLDYSF